MGYVRLHMRWKDCSGCVQHLPVLTVVYALSTTVSLAFPFKLQRFEILYVSARSAWGIILQRLGTVLS